MLTRKDVESLFGMLGALARDEDKLVEIAVYGGAALVLVFPARPATRDVDAVMLEDAAWVRSAAARIVAERDDLDDTWLNDGVKDFLSVRDAERESRTLFRSYPSEDDPGLRVFTATPTYLLAMKCMAMRIAGVDATQDKGDIVALVDHLGLKSVDDVLDIVARFYPRKSIPPKTAFGIADIFDERATAGRASPWKD